MPYGGPNAKMTNRSSSPGELLQGLMERLGFPAATRRGVGTLYEATPLEGIYNAPQHLASGRYGQAALAGAEVAPWGLAATLAGKAAKGVKGALYTPNPRAVPGGNNPPEPMGPIQQELAAPRNTVDVPNLREMPTYADAARVAQTEAHLVPKNDGGFIGAPSNIMNKQDLNSIRNVFDNEVFLGAGGADWYDNATAWNRASTSSAAAAHGQSRNLALHSAQSTPETNLQFALKGDRSYAAGTPAPVTRTSLQADKLYNSYRTGEDIPLGPKTDVYSGHMDPTVPEPVTGTNDIWHARAFGFRDAAGKPWDAALSGAQHKFLDYETVLATQRANNASLGGRSDWTPGKIQAAAWVTGKGRELAKKKGISLEAGIEEAKKAYAEYAHKHTVSMPSEQVPGAASGILQGMTPAQRKKFSSEATWSDPKTGRDLSTPYDTFTPPGEQGLGAYMNSAKKMEPNLVEVNKSLVPFDDVKGVKTVPDYAWEPIRAQAAVRGLVDMQEGSTAHIIKPGAGPRTAMDIQSGPLDKPSLKKLLAAGDKHDMGLVSNTEGGYAMARSEHFDDVPDLPKASKALTKGEGALVKELRGIVGDAPIIRRGAWQGEYIDLSAEMAKPGKGKMVDKVLGVLDEVKQAAPDAYEKILDSTGIQLKSQANLKRYNKWSATLGEAQRADYVKLLNIVGEKKLRGLRDYVSKYGSAGLPAVSLLALGLGQELPGEGDAAL